MAPKYTDFLISERLRDVFVIPSAVSPSTITYWKLSGTIISVNARMPQTASSPYSGLSVKILTKYWGMILEMRNITAVKQKHSISTQKNVFRIRSGLFAP